MKASTRQQFNPSSPRYCDFKGLCIKVVIKMYSKKIPSDESASETESCALDCPAKDRTCAASTCCGPSKQVHDVNTLTGVVITSISIPTSGDGSSRLEHVSISHPNRYKLIRKRRKPVLLLLLLFLLPKTTPTILRRSLLSLFLPLLLHHLPMMATLSMSLSNCLELTSARYYFSSRFSFSK